MRVFHDRSTAAYQPRHAHYYGAPTRWLGKGRRCSSHRRYRWLVPVVAFVTACATLALGPASPANASCTVSPDPSGGVVCAASYVLDQELAAAGNISTQCFPFFLNQAGATALCAANTVLAANVALIESCAAGGDAFCNAVLSTAKALAASVAACATGGSGELQACTTAKQLIITTEALVQACAAGQDTTCNTVLSLASLVAATATSCAGGTDPTCNAVIGLANSLVGLVTETVTGCAAGTNETCNTVVRTVSDTVNLARSTAAACANGQNETCNEAIAALAAAVQEAEATVGACLDGTDSTCAAGTSTAGVDGPTLCLAQYATTCTLATADDTGDPLVDPGIDPTVLTPAQAQVLATKEARAAGSQAIILAYLAGVPEGALQSNPDYVPATYDIVATNHKEGEGNLKPDGTYKFYTCGPASSRNMVQSFTGTDYTEGKFETWEATSPVNGTPIGSISQALNAHFSSYDTWAPYPPKSGTDLINHVANDVYHSRHGVIFNVQTQYLRFWNGHNARHYDWAYGYDATAGQVHIAEEWDPVYNNANSSLSKYGGKNPYGLWHISGHNAFLAIHNSPSNEVVY
jgi:hypothetical protein